MLSSDQLRQNVPVSAAALRTIIVFIAVLTIPLAAAQTMGLSRAQTSAWIFALYGLPALLSLILTIRYREPLLLTGNLFVIIFISGLGEQLTYPEIVGASVLAGAGVLLVGMLGLSAYLASWVPTPIMFGLLAGAVMPFVVGIFSSLGDAPMLVGGTFAAYLLSRRIFGNRLPPILSALVVGLAIAALAGQFGSSVEFMQLEAPAFTVPVFSVPALVTITPVLIVLITIQANLPSLLFLHSHDYNPPDRVINIMSGVGTMLGSLIGPTGISLSLPATSLVAGPEAGEHAVRHRSIYLVAAAALVVGLLAGIAADLASVIPSNLIFTLAGLAVVDVLAGALRQVTRGPLLLGPLVAFAIALSEISFLGFGNYFWALVIGTVVSLLLEADELKAFRDAAVP